MAPEDQAIIDQLLRLCAETHGVDATSFWSAFWSLARDVPDRVVQKDADPDLCAAYARVLAAAAKEGYR